MLITTDTMIMRKESSVGLAWLKKLTPKNTLYLKNLNAANATSY